MHRWNFLHLMVDENGISRVDPHFHQTLQAVEFAPPAPPMLVCAPADAKALVMVELPVGWQGGWHPSPQAFSMLLGFVFWYHGLAQGGIAAVGQLQLLQPFMGLGLAALLLHETVSWTMLVVTVAAVVCVAGAKKYAQ